MAKPDWGALQHQFLAEHAKTGISPKDWWMNYTSAKFAKVCRRLLTQPESW
ncbi:MAG: hypothetical protein RRZ38_13965 [Hafnia sp.]